MVTSLLRKHLKMLKICLQCVKVPCIVLSHESHCFQFNINIRNIFILHMFNITRAASCETLCNVCPVSRLCELASHVIKIILR